nr:MAG TPA: hypothetical protein [Bacteriophage sp.]
MTCINLLYFILGDNLWTCTIYLIRYTILSRNAPNFLN